MRISKIVLIIIGFAVLASYSGQWEVFTNKNDVRDVALANTTLWAATTGGVVAWNLNDNSYASYTTADGLLSCNINQVAIDKNGRPWVATKEPTGLCVYENHAWKQIKIGSADNELAYTFVSGLEVDQLGNVWVYINYDRYLWRYDGQTWHKHEGVHGPLALDLQKNLLAVDSLAENEEDVWRFRIVSFNGSEFKLCREANHKTGHFPVTHFAFAHIAQDSKGNLWFSYFDDRYGDTYGVVCNNTLYNTLDGLADDNVRSITADESGAVWCATDGGISKFTETGWVTYDTTKGVASNLVYTILIGSDNTLYAATSKGISILKSNQWKTLKTINEPSHNNYTDMAIDKRDAVVFAGSDHIAIYDSLHWEMNYLGNTRIGDSEYHHSSYNHLVKYHYNNYKSFIKSKEGNVYAIGNESEKGWILKQVTGESTFFKAFSCRLEKPNRMLSPAVVYNDSCIWLTDLRGNLIMFNKQKATIFPPSQLGVQGYVNYILPDRDESSVWIGYGDSYHNVAAIHFDGDTVNERITKNDGLTGTHIPAIARDSSENLWFASNSGVAVLHDTILTKYQCSDDRWFCSYNHVLFVDNSGIVWAHSSSGIARFDGHSWKHFDSVTVSPDLPYARYSHIIQDTSGTVWFGTEGMSDYRGSGLLAYKDNRWYQFTTRDGIPCNSIRSLDLDSKNNLWILTDNGIAKGNPGELFRTQTQCNFKNPGNKRKINQSGNR
ncbi:MAG: hypothetical protein PVI26_07785, partial [Chitinispirillia bacterium]